MLVKTANEQNFKHRIFIHSASDSIFCLNTIKSDHKKFDLACSGLTIRLLDFQYYQNHVKRSNRSTNC